LTSPNAVGRLGSSVETILSSSADDLRDCFTELFEIFPFQCCTAIPRRRQGTGRYIRFASRQSYRRSVSSSRKTEDLPATISGQMASLGSDLKPNPGIHWPGCECIHCPFLWWLDVLGLVFEGTRRESVTLPPCSSLPFTGYLHRSISQMVYEAISQSPLHWDRWPLQKHVSSPPSFLDIGDATSHDD